jgi:hypothetical protein
MEVIRFDRTGKVDYNWLKGTHYFSFGKYYNPIRLGL